MSPAEPPFALQQVTDGQHGGLVAFVFECPAGWRAGGAVAWRMEDVSLPFAYRAEASAPDGVERFELLTPASFCWVQPDYGLYRRGQNALGQIYLPPMPAADALTGWLIPRHRGDRPGLTVLDVRPLPALAQVLNVDTLGLEGEGIVVRVAYNEGPRAIEEEFFGVRVAQDVPYYGPMGLTTQSNWGFVRLFSLRAARGELDARGAPLWRIAASVRFNPAWERLRDQVMQQLQAQFNRYIQMGYSQIQAAGELSRAISANNDALLAGFERQRQAAAQAATRSSGGSDRSPNEGFSEYIRGVETVADPYHDESQQDYTYQYHWTDGSGGYQHSNDPFFNPNIGAGSGPNWTLMEPKRG